MAIEKDFFRHVMGHFVTGVTVVTTKYQETVAGLTVNAFCSVSLNPPLVLVCVDVTSNTLAFMRESGCYAINILTKEQEHLSRCFATLSAERYEDFCHAQYHTVTTGAPVIDDALAFIDARIVAEYPGGDHIIFLGQVEAMGMGGKVVYAHEGQQEEVVASSNGTLPHDDVMPLTYYKGTYRHLAATYHTPSLSTTITTHDNT